MAKLKARTNKCSTEVVTQAQKWSQNGDQCFQAHLTKVTSIVTGRQALVEDEPDENDSQNARRGHGKRPEANGHDFKLVEAKVKSAAEPLVKSEHNHLQAKLGQASTQLHNVTAAIYGQKKLLAASQQVHASIEKVETVDATAERPDDKVSRRNRRCERRSSNTAHCGCFEWFVTSLSSLDEDDNLVQQRRHVARCRVRSRSGSS